MNKKKIVIIISMLLVVSCNRSPLKNILNKKFLIVLEVILKKIISPMIRI